MYVKSISRGYHQNILLNPQALYMLKSVVHLLDVHPYLDTYKDKLQEGKVKLPKLMY